MNLEEQIRATVREAMAEALEEWEPPDAPPAEEDEGWRSRVHRVHPDTRLSLAEVAEVLDCSERTVRRHLAGEGDRPALPSRRGPTGPVVTAGELLEWIEDLEEGERWRARRAS